MIKIKIFYAYIIRTVIPPFLISFLLFTFFVETLDVVVNLIKYLDRAVPLMDIMYLQWLYLPTSMSYALPIAILFSVSFSIGSLYANHELIAIYISGVSLFRLIIPLLLLGIMLSVGNFYFREYIVIDTLREKNELTRLYLNQQLTQSNSQVAIIQDGGNVVYYADFYDDNTKELDNPIIIITDNNNKLQMRINADDAVWTGSEWVFSDVNMYVYDSATETYQVQRATQFTDPSLTVDPENFQRIITNIDEMRYGDALEYIEQLKGSGYAYAKLLTDTYARIPLSLSPLVIMFISCLSGSLFKKNTMLLSLLNALLTSIVYYSVDLMGSILATRDILPPLIGAWLGFGITFMLSISVYKFLIK